MRYPKSIENLIKHFMRLPSVGPKTAERYVFQLLREDKVFIDSFARTLIELQSKTVHCAICHCIAEASPCETCSNPRRQQDLLCITTNTQDMLAIEATNQFQGMYFILGGLINTIENIRPEDLNIRELIETLRSRKIQEIILALGATLEAETTAMYLIKVLKPLNTRITRLARGLSTGANLEYADEMTIANALKYRNEI